MQAGDRYVRKQDGWVVVTIRKRLTNGRAGYKIPPYQKNQYKSRRGLFGFLYKNKKRKFFRAGGSSRPAVKSASVS
jgi:hypothetical protein